LTPEEAALVLRALGFGRETQIYIAAGEIYGGERRLAQLRALFPRIVSFHLHCSFSYHFSVYLLDIKMVQNNSTNGLLWIMQNFPCALCLWLKIGLALRGVGWP